MDYHLKVVSKLPAPSNYKMRDVWLLTEDQKKKVGRRKVDSSLSKYTYIDGIVTEEKNRGKPGVGTYNLRRSESDLKEELARLKTRKYYIGPKRFFYEDHEHLSNVHSGMGAYNPHDNDISHKRANNTDHKFWKNKHEKMQKSFEKKRMKETSPCHYNPMACEEGTFDRIFTANEMRKKRKS